MKPIHLALALTLAAPGVAPAQEIDPGTELFAYYCAYCHGDDAKGEGILSPFLTIPVPDLTGLSARNGGTFPMLRVVHLLNGTWKDKLHGGPMPDFGPLFDEETQGYGDKALSVLDRNGRILTLALYLEGLQAD
ncbi:c-type cytochrome [Oceaniglobus roseus]|uniref:c-type cytochrome n=1 Tax=Oceaniglobus roseus TaxID=1737570 RepID=UPI000C7F733E|nr:c-type cytochrome [Kandeliimicrobium roseum]